MEVRQAELLEIQEKRENSLKAMCDCQHIVK